MKVNLEKAKNQPEKPGWLTKKKVIVASIALAVVLIGLLVWAIYLAAGADHEPAQDKGSEFPFWILPPVVMVYFLIFLSKKKQSFDLLAYINKATGWELDHLDFVRDTPAGKLEPGQAGWVTHCDLFRWEGSVWLPAHITLDSRRSIHPVLIVQGPHSELPPYILFFGNGRAETVRSARLPDAGYKLLISLGHAEAPLTELPE